MAQNTTIVVPANTWTLLTDADVTTVTFQNQGSNSVLIKATADETEPTDKTGALQYHPGTGENNMTVADVFLGVDTPVRLWAFSSDTVPVMISHAGEVEE
jgi:hypothetical protein